jgi:hypothetical protein
MALANNKGQKGRQGFPSTDIPPLNIAKIPRESQTNPEFSNSNKDIEKPSEDPQLNKKIRKDRKLDEALKETFPASDPAQQP